MSKNKKLINEGSMSLYDIVCVLKERKKEFYILLLLVLFVGMGSSFIKYQNYNMPATAKFNVGMFGSYMHGNLTVEYVQNPFHFVEKLNSMPGIMAVHDLNYPEIISIKASIKNYDVSYERLTTIINAQYQSNIKLFENIKENSSRFKDNLEKEVNILTAKFNKNNTQKDITAIEQEIVKNRKTLILLDSVVKYFQKPEIIVAPDIYLLSENFGLSEKVKASLKTMFLYFIMGLFVSTFLVLIYDRYKKQIDE